MKRMQKHPSRVSNMVDKQLSFAFAFVMFGAMFMSAVSLALLWEARGQQGMCNSLNETVCGNTKQCYWVVPEGGHPKEDEHCKRHSMVDWLATGGIIVSVALWGSLSFVFRWVDATKQNIYRLAAVYAVAIAGFTAFLGAMWIVLGSTAAGVFFVLFTVVIAASAVAGGVVLVLWVCETTPPPDYSTVHPLTDEQRKEAS